MSRQHLPRDRGENVRGLHLLGNLGSHGSMSSGSASDNSENPAMVTAPLGLNLSLAHTDTKTSERISFNVTSQKSCMEIWTVKKGSVCMHVCVCVHMLYTNGSI